MPSLKKMLRGTRVYWLKDHCFAESDTFFVIVSAATSMVRRIALFYFMLAHILLLDIISAYWISQNRLTWNESLNYCRVICNSDLASFHNESDYLKAKHLIINSSYLDLNNGFNDIGGTPHYHHYDIWIGLKRLNNTVNNFTWSDNTA